jgi:cobalt-zinc-cadmium efflux system membrane fusion protein
MLSAPTEKFSGSTTVSPDESTLVNIRPLARGVIEEVRVRRGDRVRKGATLIQYDNIELGELIGRYIDQHLQIHSAEAEVEVSRKFWERGLELLEVQAIARKEVELRELEFKKAEAALAGRRGVLENIEEKLHRFGMSEEDINALNETHSGGHRTASHSLLKAPFSGVIIDYNVAQGEVVDPTRELMTLADLSTVWVLADIYEQDLGLLKEGQMVEVVSSS